MRPLLALLVSASVALSCAWLPATRADWLVIGNYPAGADCAESSLTDATAFPIQECVWTPTDRYVKVTLDSLTRARKTQFTDETCSREEKSSNPVLYTLDECKNGITKGSLKPDPTTWSENRNKVSLRAFTPEQGQQEACTSEGTDVLFQLRTEECTSVVYREGQWYGHRMELLDRGKKLRHTIFASAQYADLCTLATGEPRVYPVGECIVEKAQEWFGADEAKIRAYWDIVPEPEEEDDPEESSSSSTGEEVDSSSSSTGTEEEVESSSSTGGEGGDSTGSNSACSLNVSLASMAMFLMAAVYMMA